MARRKATVDRQCKHCHKPLRIARVQYHPECKIEAYNQRETGKRYCVKCKALKPEEGFSKDSSRPSGFFPYCKACQVSASSKDMSGEATGRFCPLCQTELLGHANRRFCSNTCKNRVASLRKYYGLTVEQYLDLIADTKGLCPICKKRPRKWNVDHDHRLLIPLGVVCTRCNVGLLAYSGHDIETAERLVEFLRYSPVKRLGIEAHAPGQANRKGNLHRTWNH